VAENLLARKFDPQSPNEAWVADITYIPTREGWLYLAAVEDLYSRRVVGWSMADHLQSRLVVDALEMAVQRRLPGRGCWPTRTGAASTPASTTSACWPGTASSAA
jgi:transposase InsO family protein